MHKRKVDQHTKYQDKPVERVSRKFKFAYIDPASMTHTYFFYEKPKADDNGLYEPFKANGIQLAQVELKPENIVPLK